MDCLELCLSLPSTDDGVDVEWIKLESVASAPAVLGSDHGSPGAQEWVKDTISSGTAILDGINDQGDGLWGGVESEKISYLELTTIPPINVQCGGGLQLPFAKRVQRVGRPSKLSVYRNRPGDPEFWSVQWPYRRSPFQDD